MFLNNYFLSDDSFHWLTSNVTSICNLVSWKKTQHNFVSLKNWSSSSMEKNEFQAINADILAFFCTHVSRNKFVEIFFWSAALKR
jgi:hypothetical protein